MDLLPLILATERERIAKRLLLSYSRRLLLDSESNYVNRDEVLRHLSTVLDVFDCGANAPQTPSGAACGEDGEGG